MFLSSSSASWARVPVRHVAAAAICGCATLTAAQAQVEPPIKDTYITLSLPGVVGDFNTVPNAPTNSIEVLALSFGASCPGNRSTPCGAASVSDLNISKQPDSASPALFLALVRGMSYATAVINFWQVGFGGIYRKTYTISLTHARLTSLQQSGAGGGAPSENASIAFQTITLQDNATGTVSCYNVSTNTASNTLTC